MDRGQAQREAGNHHILTCLLIPALISSVIMAYKAGNARSDFDPIELQEYVTEMVTLFVATIVMELIVLQGMAAYRVWMWDVTKEERKTLVLTWKNINWAFIAVSSMCLILRGLYFECGIHLIVNHSFYQCMMGPIMDKLDCRHAEILDMKFGEDLEIMPDHTIIVRPKRVNKQKTKRNKRNKMQIIKMRNRGSGRN